MPMRSGWPGTAQRLRAPLGCAEALAVADELTVSETLVRVADDVDAAAIVVGRHDHSALHDVLVGSTAKGLLRQAPCPVLMVRSPTAA
jgi:nucleotide-binding universal stress UspA family protein